jgi:hypothetical protein
MNDDHSTTGVLRKASPFWWWVRGNPSLIVTLLVLTAGIVGSWYDVKSQVGGMKESIKQLREQVDKLPQHSEVSSEDLTQLRNAVAQMQGRWQQVDSVPIGSRHARKP